MDPDTDADAQCGQMFWKMNTLQNQSNYVEFFLVYWWCKVDIFVDYFFPFVVCLYLMIFSFANGSKSVYSKNNFFPMWNDNSIYIRSDLTHARPENV